MGSCSGLGGRRRSVVSGRGKRQQRDKGFGAEQSANGCTRALAAGRRHACGSLRINRVSVVHLRLVNRSLKVSPLTTSSSDTLLLLNTLTTGSEARRRWLL